MIQAPVIVAQGLAGGRIEQVTRDTHRQAIDMARAACKTYSLSVVIRRDNLPDGYLEYECYKEKTLHEWLAPLAKPTSGNGGS